MGGRKAQREAARHRAESRPRKRGQTYTGRGTYNRPRAAAGSSARRLSPLEQAAAILAMRGGSVHNVLLGNNHRVGATGGGRRRVQRLQARLASSSSAVSGGVVPSPRMTAVAEPMAKLSKGMIKAISNLQYPAFKKYSAISNYSTGAYGTSAWMVFTAGTAADLVNTYQNHTSAITSTYLPDPSKKVALSMYMTIDVFNGTNIPAYYKCWKYLAKKDHPYTSNAADEDFTTNFANNTISGIEAATAAAGESAYTLPTLGDLNAVPSMNKGWSVNNRTQAPVEFTLKPGESRRLTFNTGEKWFDPVDYNVNQSKMSTATDGTDAFRGFTGGWLVRAQGTFVSESAAPQTVSTGKTLTQYVLKKHFTSHLISAQQTKVSNNLELTKTAVSAPVLMGSGGIQGKTTFTDLSTAP